MVPILCSVYGEMCEVQCVGGVVSCSYGCALCWLQTTLMGSSN